MNDLRDIATLCKEIDYLTKQADTLRKERDEARREICINAANELSYELGGRIILARDEAKKRGWDCFTGDGK